jgi:DNA (cytosine-5)-methyltransferase 1
MGVVLGDLAEMGFDARWGVFSAADVGARHERERIWILAKSNKVGLYGDLPKVDGVERTGKTPTFRRPNRIQPEMVSPMCRTLDASWKDFPDASRDLDDVANWMDRIKATGNGQVPAVVRLAWETLN